MSSKRVKLPNRRLSEVRKVETDDGRKFYVTIGYDPKEPTAPKEVFYDNRFKEGSDMQFIATDMCIMISMCLQAGFTHKQIANSLSKFEGPMGDRHGSPVGIIVDELAKPPQWDLSVN